MSELKKTLLFCASAVVLTAAAVAVDPGARSPSIFNDQGEVFYPGFTDPQAPKAIEVIEYNDETATATPLKVEFRDGQWLIPSHHDYPADAENRLADTSAALIELKKDILVSDRVEDHAEYGVIDPLDESGASLEGRGNRVTLRDEGGEVLADFIIGKDVADKPGYKYMRVPEQRRVYAVQTDAKISSRFQDWIETDLLKINTIDLRRVVVKGYSIQTDPFGRPAIRPAAELTLTRNEDNQWRLGGREPNKEATRQLEQALDQLRIVDVQQKPAILTADLKTKGKVEPTMQAAQALVQRGFYLGGDGSIYGAEGELIVDTKNGLRYTLRFGEIAQGGAGASADAEEGEEETGENRFLFIAVDYSKAREEQYEGSGGEELGRELSDRFAEWYYVITGSEFDHLTPAAADLR